MIGGGPGGYAAAFLAADLGLSTTLVDTEPNPGGVCVYRGCIPSKALLHVAKLLDESRHARAWGIEFGEPRIDLDKLREFKDSVVKRLTSGTGQLAKHRKVNYVQGLRRDRRCAERARQKDGRRGRDAPLRARDHRDRIGSRHPADAARRRPARDGFDLRARSARHPEDSCSWSAAATSDSSSGRCTHTLGSAVTVVEMTGGLLPGADRDLVDILARRINQMMKSVLLNTRVTQMKAEKKGIRVTFEGEAVTPDTREQLFDRVLVSVGRRPNSSVPGLDKTRVQVDDRGFIVVDEQLRTAEPSIFAVGDVVGEPMLAHKASHEGRVAVEVIAGENVAFQPKAIPAVVFTDPELAWAGLTEAQAQKEGRKITVARFPWGASGRAITLDRVDGATKLILDPETERILGVGLVGPGAGELIAEGVLAIEMGANATDLKLSIHPHPTLTETMMESAEVFFGQATHVYRPRR